MSYALVRDTVMHQIVHVVTKVLITLFPISKFIDETGEFCRL